MNATATIEITTETFFNDLVRWKMWVEKSLASAKQRLEIARSKPEGAEHDSNLYMATDGTIWAKYGDTWHELTRKTNAPYAEYVATPRFKTSNGEVYDGSVQSVVRPNGTKLVFIKRSWYEHEEEDWGWQIKDKNSWPPPHPSARYYEHSVQMDQRGLQLAKALLEKRDEIEAWMQSYAESQGEHRAYDRCMLDRDWASLLGKFAPGLKGISLPDEGSLICNLHAVLDQLALGRQVRSYCH